MGLPQIANTQIYICALILSKLKKKSFLYVGILFLKLFSIKILLVGFFGLFWNLFWVYPLSNVHFICFSINHRFHYQMNIRCFQEIPDRHIPLKHSENRRPPRTDSLYSKISATSCTVRVQVPAPTNCHRSKNPICSIPILFVKERGDKFAICLFLPKVPAMPKSNNNRGIAAYRFCCDRCRIMMANVFIENVRVWLGQTAAIKVYSL